MSPLGCILHNWEGWALTHMLSLSPVGRGNLSWHQVGLPWGRNDVGRVKRFLLLSPLVQTCIFLLLSCPRTFHLESWTSTKALSPLVDSRDSQTTAERIWSQFMGHCRVYSWDQGLSAYYLSRGWQDSSCIPWPMVLDPTAPSVAPLSMDGCQIFAVG